MWLLALQTSDAGWAKWGRSLVCFQCTAGCPGGFALGLAGCQLGPLFVLCVCVCVSPLCAQACPPPFLAAAFQVVSKISERPHSPFYHILLPGASCKASPDSGGEETDSISRGAGLQKPPHRGAWIPGALEELRPFLGSSPRPQICISSLIGLLVSYVAALCRVSPLHRLPPVQGQHKPRASRHCFYPRRPPHIFTTHLRASIISRCKKINFDDLASFIPLGQRSAAQGI